MPILSKARHAPRSLLHSESHHRHFESISFAVIWDGGFNSTVKVSCNSPVEWVCCQSNERSALVVPDPPSASDPTQVPGKPWCRGRPRKRWGNRRDQDRELSSKCASRMRTLHTHPVPFFRCLELIDWVINETKTNSSLLSHLKWIITYTVAFYQWILLSHCPRGCIDIVLL